MLIRCQTASKLHVTVAVHFTQSAQEEIAVMAKTGRPTDSGVWKYFKYDEGTKMSISLVCTEEKKLWKADQGKISNQSGI